MIIVKVDCFFGLCCAGGEDGDRKKERDRGGKVAKSGILGPRGRLKWFKLLRIGQWMRRKTCRKVHGRNGKRCRLPPNGVIFPSGNIAASFSIFSSLGSPTSVLVILFLLLSLHLLLAQVYCFSCLVSLSLRRSHLHYVGHWRQFTHRKSWCRGLSWIDL